MRELISLKCGEIGGKPEPDPRGENPTKFCASTSAQYHSSDRERAEVVRLRLAKAIASGDIELSRRTRVLLLRSSLKRLSWLCQCTATTPGHQRDLDKTARRIWSELIKYDDSVVYEVESTSPTLREINRREVEIEKTKYAKRPGWDLEVVEKVSAPTESIAKSPVLVEAGAEDTDCDDWHYVGKKLKCWDSSCSNVSGCKDRDHIKWSRMMERASDSWRERHFACGSLSGYIKFKELDKATPVEISEPVAKTWQNKRDLVSLEYKAARLLAKHARFQRKLNGFKQGECRA